MNAGGVDKACKSNGPHHTVCDAEVPNYKFQITNKFKILNTKFKTSVWSLDFWLLDIVWKLVLVIYDFRIALRVMRLVANGVVTRRNTPPSQV
jgi:hypothetical protein